MSSFVGLNIFTIETHIQFQILLRDKISYLAIHNDYPVFI